MKFKMFCVMIVVAMAVVACGNQERITRVQWMADGEIAVVNYRSSEGKMKTYKLRCKEQHISAPFSYMWEDDCDLNTELNGFVQDWDNPEDNRFENRVGQGSNEDYYHEEDDDFHSTEFLLGAIVGDKISKKKPKKTKINYSSKPAYKPVYSASKSYNRSNTYSRTTRSSGGKRR